MKKNKKDQKARSQKAASILRTVEEKDLAKVSGGICRTCGLVGAPGDPRQFKLA